MNSQYGALFGKRPLWGGFDAKLSDGAFHAPQAPRTKWGWRIKVLWIMDPQQAEPIEVTGANTTTTQPLWFQISGTKPTRLPSFHPAEPENISERGNWKEFSSYLFFPRAGCYRITETWPSGNWSLTVGMGR